MSKVTLQFLQQLFQNIYPDVTIDSFEEAPASERGDNYTAILYRIHLKGLLQNETPWTKRIIYKCLPENTLRREAFRSDKLFKNEVIFYTKVLPTLSQFQEVRKSKLQFKAVPQCYYAKDNVIILEDMCERGFRMANRKQGLNFQQILAVLKELAHFHALSLALKTAEPHKFYSLIGENGIQEVLFSGENEEWYHEYYKRARKNALAMVQAGFRANKMEGKYVGKFAEFVDDGFFAHMIELVSHETDLAVFCHGDCWTNNFFFKMEEGYDIQVYFIDFQICRFGSLALDLANLIYCCTTRYIRDHNLGTFLEVYENHLHGALVELLAGVDVPEKGALCKRVQEEFRRCGLFGLGLAIDIMPISTCDSDEAPDMYVSEEECEERPQVLSTNEICKAKMINLVADLVDNGIL